MAVRRVQTVSSTGSSDSYRVRTNLTLEVTKTTFSPAASSSQGNGQGEKKEPTASLQISGKVVEENEFVKMGAYHTLDLEGKFFLGGLIRKNQGKYGKKRRLTRHFRRISEQRF